MARYLEEKDIQNKKEEESCLSSKSEAVLPSPPSAKTKDKKSVDKGRIVNSHAIVLNVWYQSHSPVLKSDRY